MSKSPMVFLASVLLSTTLSAFASAPLIIAHRGGTGDGPENTAYTIEKSLHNKADAIWVTLQLTKDNVIVLYRPSDLSSLTSLTGTVSSFTADELTAADAAWKYLPPDYPLRGKGIHVPTLESVLKKWPDTFFYLDIKSPDASPQQFASTLLTLLKNTHSLKRVRVYSTDEKYTSALPEAIPRFESRDLTRTALANITMDHLCTLPAEQGKGKWYGFEFRREVQVIEKFTLGEGVSTSYLQWDPEAFKCFTGGNKNKVVLFGINTPEDYQQAKALGAYGVLVDSPEKFKERK